MRTVFNKILIILALCAVSSMACAADTVVPVTPGNKAPLVVVPPQKGAEPQKGPQLIKIGYADMSKIAAESDFGKAAQLQVKQKQEKVQSQVVSRRKQLDKQKAAIEAKMSTYTPQQREVKAKEFQKKVDSFQKFGMGAEKELLQFQENLSKVLYESIEKASAEYGKANNLTLVVVKRELLYLASGVDAQDVTEGIIKLMNVKVPKK